MYPLKRRVDYRRAYWLFSPVNPARPRHRCRGFVRGLPLYGNQVEWKGATHPLGLYGEDKPASLYHGNVQCLQHSIFQSPEVNEKDSEPVQLRDAYELLRDKLVGRCILKIDTEGCELSILRRIKPLLHHVDIIYLEYHHEQQRRLLDKELDSYSVISSSAKFLHRGNVTYGSARLVKEHPGLDQWGIQPGES
jgi:hypothetical protein